MTIKVNKPLIRWYFEVAIVTIPVALEPNQHKFLSPSKSFHDETVENITSHFFEVAKIPNPDTETLVKLSHFLWR